VLYAVAHLRVAFTEGDALDSATVVALQQRGIIRRRARAGYLELTDDARFSSCRVTHITDTFVRPSLALHAVSR
jgi:hypothetical protein